MSYRWPEDTDFVLWELDVLDRDCPSCGRMMHICDHRYRRFYTLDGPVQLICKLNHCPDPRWPGHAMTKSPELEITIALPQMAIGWDVLCWIGHRRFSRHMAVPLIRAELLEDFGIKLSADAIEGHIRRYQVMVAARQQDPRELRRLYGSTTEIILCIDGLQPEKGHETLYVVRELTRRRVWFAEPLLSATESEVRRLIVKAKEWAESLGMTVGFWTSDKQDAFVKSIAGEFPDVPHRYCDNHFLRDLAKPVLEADSHAKVRMRKKVRGLRAVERAVLRKSSQPSETIPPDVTEADDTAIDVETSPVSIDPGDSVVLDYCAAVRGVLNDDQGGAAASARVADVRGVGRGAGAAPTGPRVEKRGFAEERLGRLSRCIEGGLAEVREQQAVIRDYVGMIKEVAATLEPGPEDITEREEKFEGLIDRFEATEDPIRHGMAAVILSFLAGLFVGEEEYEAIRDNLKLERWFRLAKGHERRIHGHLPRTDPAGAGGGDAGPRTGRPSDPSRPVDG